MLLRSEKGEKKKINWGDVLLLGGVCGPWGCIYMCEWSERGLRAMRVCVGMVRFALRDFFRILFPQLEFAQRRSNVK